MKFKKETRKAVADANKLRWEALTTREKIEDLDRRLGVGVGAKKQRARLQALLLKTESVL
jgi:hypothetical protein